MIYTPTKMSIIKWKENKCWQGCGDIGSHMYYWWECKLVRPHWKTIWQFLEKLNIESPYVSAILLLGRYPRTLEAGTQTGACSPTPRGHSSLNCDTREVWTTQMSIFGKGMGRDCWGGRRVCLGGMRMFWNDRVALVAQPCECAKCHQIVYFFKRLGLWDVNYKSIQKKENK